MFDKSFTRTHVLNYIQLQICILYFFIRDTKLTPNFDKSLVFSCDPFTVFKTFTFLDSEFLFSKLLLQQGICEMMVSCN